MRAPSPRGCQKFVFLLDEYCESLRRSLAARLHGNYRWACDAWQVVAPRCASVRHISDMNFAK